MQAPQLTPEESLHQTKVDIYAREVFRLVAEITRVRAKVRDDTERLKNTAGFYVGHGNSQQFGGMLKSEYEPVRRQVYNLMQLLVADKLIENNYEFEVAFTSSSSEHYGEIDARANDAQEELKKIGLLLYK